MPSTVPHCGYANSGGKINQSRLNLMFAHCDIACITEPGTITKAKLLSQFHNVVSQKITAIIYSNELKEPKPIVTKDNNIEGCGLKFINNQSIRRFCTGENGDEGVELSDMESAKQKSAQSEYFSKLKKPTGIYSGLYPLKCMHIA